MCNYEFEPSWKVSVPVAEQWQTLYLDQLQRRQIESLSCRRMEVDFLDIKVFIDASQSAAATIYAICIMKVQYMCVAQRFLTCAHRIATHRLGHSSVAIVIPHSVDP